MNDPLHDPVTRDEFKSEIGRVEAVLGTQIGAVERTLNAKLGNLRSWGVTALVGGQVVGSLVTAYITRLSPPEQVHAVGHLIANWF